MAVTRPQVATKISIDDLMLASTIVTDRFSRWRVVGVMDDVTVITDLTLNSVYNL
jgi:hypothetical protein